MALGLTRDKSRPVAFMASHLMTTPVFTVREDATVRSAASLMLTHRLGALPVVSVSGAPIGIVSDGDLLGRRQRDPHREWWLDLLTHGSPRREAPRFVGERLVSGVMTAPLITAAPDMPAGEIATLMRGHHVKRLPVVAEGKLVGIVSRTDLLRLVETETKPLSDGLPANALLEFLESMIGGASLRGIWPRLENSVSKDHVAAPASNKNAFSAKTLQGDVQTFADEKRDHLIADRDAARLKRQRDVKVLLQAHLQEAFWQELLIHAEAAAKNGELEMLMLAFPCELCSDGGRMIDVAEPGWESTLRGEAAEVYTRWQKELEPLGFGAQARINGYDEHGVIVEAGLFLNWG